MLDFNTANAIYLQIAEYVCDQIASGKWLPGDKVPSVRDLAVQVEVNPNTVMRAYEHLQQQEIIYTKRGLGYYVGDSAPGAIRQSRKEQFIKEELPQLLRKMEIMDISREELQRQIDNFYKTNQGK